MPEDTLRAKKKKKQKIDNVDHICFDDPQEHLFPSPQKNPLSIKDFPVFGVRNAGLWTPTPNSDSSNFKKPTLTPDSSIFENPTPDSDSSNLKKNNNSDSS